MAKPIKRYNVSGKTITDLLNIDINDLVKMTNREIKDVTNRLVSASNKRIRRLEASDLGKTAPALKSIRANQNEGLLTTKGKDRNQLLKLYADSRKFLNAKTSTITKYKKVIKENKKIIERKLGRSVSNINVGRMFDALHKAQEMGLIDSKGSKGSQIAMEMLAEYLENDNEMSLEDMLTRIDEDYDNYYRDTYEDTEDLDNYDIEFDE